ncbi:MAG: hypothetical protein AB1798_00860 [Spirochaetota bacterium]
MKLVKMGEIIWVMDRDEVIAEIHKPTTPIPDKVSLWEAFLNDEERKGSIKRSSSVKTPLIAELRKNSGSRKPIDLQQLMDDVRSDR